MSKRGSATPKRNCTIQITRTALAHSPSPVPLLSWHMCAARTLLDTLSRKMVFWLLHLIFLIERAQIKSDDVTTPPTHVRTQRQRMTKIHEMNPNVPVDSPDHVISAILAQSQLARTLSVAYTDLIEVGAVQMLIGGWVTVSFRVCAAEHPKLRTSALLRWKGPIAVRPYVN